MCDRDHAPGSPECPQSRVGTTLAGKYKLGKMLGAGGMGAVYAAENIALGKPVAIKMLHARLARQAELVARFRREARAVARLDHPGFPQVHALETTADGDLVIEMELLRGEPVDQLLRAPIARAIAILDSALEALAVAHEAGLVHRDLKPENLFLTEGDRVKILDFGIARAEDDHQLTASGSVFGTISYASPEQLKDTKSANARADVYSMGATAFELLCGEPAAGRGGMTEVMARILSGEIQRHPAKLRADVPPGLDAWVACALDGDPTNRFSSARHMLDALRAGAPA
jgi:serine/threonine-protein kinase